MTRPQGYTMTFEEKESVKRFILKAWWVINYTGGGGRPFVSEETQGNFPEAPSMERELNEACKAVGLPEDLPIPEYPANAHRLLDEEWNQVFVGTMKECIKYNDDAGDELIFDGSLRIIDTGEEERWYRRFNVTPPPEVVTDPVGRWKKNFPEEVEKYTGKTVAINIRTSRVVASGNTMDEVLESCLTAEGMDCQEIVGVVL